MDAALTQCLYESVGVQANGVGDTIEHDIGCELRLRAHARACARDAYTMRPLVLEHHRAVAPDVPGVGVEFLWGALEPYRMIG